MACTSHGAWAIHTTNAGEIQRWPAVPTGRKAPARPVRRQRGWRADAEHVGDNEPADAQGTEMGSDTLSRRGGSA